MSVEVISPTQAVVTLDFQEVHRTAVSLLSLLESKEINVGTGVAALGMAICKLFGPEEMTPQEEADFVQAILEWSGTYFAGKVN